MTMKTFRNQRQTGFTVVELMIVIVIVAILVAIAYPMITSGIRSAKKAACITNLKQIGVGLEAYLNDNNQIMPDLEVGRTSKSDDVDVIETVLLEYLESEECLHCPADKKHYERSGSSYFWNVTQNGLHSTKLSFFDTSSNTRIPLVFDKEAFHDDDGKEGSVNFLYADQTAEGKARFDISP